MATIFKKKSLQNLDSHSAIQSDKIIFRGAYVFIFFLQPHDCLILGCILSKFYYFFVFYDYSKTITLRSTYYINTIGSVHGKCTQSAHVIAETLSVCHMRKVKSTICLMATFKKCSTFRRNKPGKYSHSEWHQQKVN